MWRWGVTDCVQGTRENLGRITTDITFVRSLDTAECACENFIFLDVLSGDANVDRSCFTKVTMWTYHMQTRLYQKWHTSTTSLCEEKPRFLKVIFWPF